MTSDTISKSKTTIYLFGIFALVNALMPTGAIAATLEERLLALEQQVLALREENVELKKQLKPLAQPESSHTSAAAKPQVWVRPAGIESKFTLGGFIQVLGEAGGAPDARFQGMNDRFLVRRARLNVTATFAEHFNAKLEADFGANSIAGGSGARGQMTDGFVEWTRYPQAKIKAGQFKTPFGFEQLSSDTKLFTIERALSNDRLTISRQIGVGISGDLGAKRLHYSVGVFNGNGVNSGNNDNDDLLYAGRLGGSILKGERSGLKYSWNAGINAFVSDDRGSFVGERSGLGMDSQLTLGDATFLVEWLQNTRDPIVGPSVRSEGFSLVGVYAFDSQWRGVLRFDEYDSNTDRGETTTDLWTVGMDYLIKGDNLKLSLNYMKGKQPAPNHTENRIVGRVQVMF